QSRLCYQGPDVYHKVTIIETGREHVSSAYCCMNTGYYGYRVLDKKLSAHSHEFRPGKTYMQICLTHWSESKKVKTHIINIDKALTITVDQNADITVKP